MTSSGASDQRGSPGFTRLGAAEERSLKFNIGAACSAPLPDILDVVVLKALQQVARAMSCVPGWHG